MQSVSVCINMYYYSVHQKPIAGIIFSLELNRIILPFSKNYWKKIFLSKHLGFSPGNEASNTGSKCAQNEEQPLPEKPTPVLMLHFKVINQHLGILPGGWIKYRALKRPK